MLGSVTSRRSSRGRLFRSSQQSQEDDDNHCLQLRVTFNKTTQPQDEDRSPQLLRQQQNQALNSHRALLDSPIYDERVNTDIHRRKVVQSSYKFEKYEPSKEFKDSRKSQFFGLMRQGNMIKNFFYMLKRNSNKLSLMDLGKTQQSIISGLLDPELESFNNGINLLDKIPLLHIQSKITLIWDILFLTFTQISLFWYPFLYAFDLQDQEFSFQLDFLFIIILCLDLVISLNRCKIHKGLVIRNRVRIVKLYIQEVFLRDILSLMCLFLQMYFQHSAYWVISIAIYLIERIPKIMACFDDLLNFYNVSAQTKDIVSLINMFLTVIYIVHLIACSWHGISYKMSGQTWLRYYVYQDEPLPHRYIVSFYWAAMTMTTVGYGDITPKNYVEFLFANVTMLVVCILFGYTMNRIGMLLTNINLRNAELKQNLSTINAYMSKNKVDYELQSRVRSYLNYLWVLEQDQHQDVIQTLISKLSEQLRSELDYQIKGKTLQKANIFKGFSNDFVRKISSIMEEVRHAPMDVVNDGEAFENPIMIIQQGQFKYDFKESSRLKKDIFRIKEGEVYGLEQFVTDSQNNCKVISVNFSQSLKIPRNRFLTTINDLEHDKELFFLIKETLIFKGKSLHLTFQCRCCNSTSHSIMNCPYLKLQTDREKIIKQYLYPVEQDENKVFIRGIKLQRYSSRLNSQLMQRQVEKVQFRIAEELRLKEIVETPEYSDSNQSFTASDSNIIIQTQLDPDVRKPDSYLTLPREESPGLKRNQNRYSKEKLQIQLSAHNNDVNDEKDDVANSSASIMQIQHRKSQSNFEIGVKEGQRGRYVEKINQASVRAILLEKDRSPTHIPKSEKQARLSPGLKESTKIRRPSAARESRFQIKTKQDLTDASRMSARRITDQYTSATFIENDQTINIQEFFQVDFEKLQSYQIYFPHGNVENVLKRYMDTQKQKNPVKKLSLFTFDFQINKKAEKVKKHFQREIYRKSKQLNQEASNIVIN